MKGGIDFSTHLIIFASLTNENELFEPFVREYEAVSERAQSGSERLIYVDVTGAFVTVKIVSRVLQNPRA